MGEISMDGLLALSRAIDRVSASIGRSVAWLIVAAALVGLDRAWGKRFRGVRGALVHGEESDARRHT